MASGAAPTATSTPCSSSTFDIPVSDVACALANLLAVQNNYTDILTKCCGDAPVTSYDSGCAQYCLSVGQSTGQLTACLQSQGANPADIFCNSKSFNQTATAVLSPSSTGGSDSGKAGGGDGSDSGKGGRGGDGGSDSDSPSGAAKGSFATPPVAISKTAVGLATLVFFSMAAGAVGALV